LPFNSFPSPSTFNIDDFSTGDLSPANDELLYGATSKKAPLYPLCDSVVSPADISLAWDSQLGIEYKVPTATPSSCCSSSESDSEHSPKDEEFRPIKTRATRIEKRSSTSSSKRAANKSRKVPVGHNETEKKYRSRLNDQLQMLLAALPNTQEETVTTKKASVLERARLRIQALEKENVRRGREMNRLVEQVMHMRSMMVAPMVI
jgi:hypothetical protein